MKVKEPMDLYPDMQGEVTQDEFMDTFVIIDCKKVNTGWRKLVDLRDASGQTYHLVLNWDENLGYSAYWEGKKPAMADRPEFEYVVDSIVTDMELDRDNPWDWYDFTENK